MWLLSHAHSDCGTHSRKTSFPSTLRVGRCKVYYWTIDSQRLGGNPLFNRKTTDLTKYSKIPPYVALHTNARSGCLRQESITNIRHVWNHLLEHCTRFHQCFLQFQIWIVRWNSLKRSFLKFNSCTFGRLWINIFHNGEFIFYFNRVIFDDSQFSRKIFNELLRVQHLCQYVLTASREHVGQRPNATTIL